MADKTWKMGDVWALLTERSPREMGRQPMAVYFPKQGPTRFQYVCQSRDEFHG